jgi:hypothetical protein
LQKQNLRNIVDVFLSFACAAKLNTQEELIMAPILNFMRCVCSLICPEPFRFGSSEADVDIVMVANKKKQQFALLAHKSTAIFVEQVRLATPWQGLHSEYSKYVGGELSKGKAANDMADKLTSALSMFRAAKKADDDDEDGASEKLVAAESDLKSLLEQSLQDVPVFRSKFRPGGTDHLDSVVKECVAMFVEDQKHQDVLMPKFFNH